jgi:cell division protein FtsZ
MVIQEVDTKKVSFEDKPRIMIIGIGGAGGNMLDALIKDGLGHISSLALNTDAQALDLLSVENKILLGKDFLRGFGTGANIDVGKVAIEGALDAVLSLVEGSDIVFLLAGFGGGTGTGATPTLAKILQEKNILTISIITKPFLFEGSKRMQIAQNAMEGIEKYSDTVISIPNQKLFDSQMMQELSLEEAFSRVNEVVANSIRAVVDTIFSPGSINIDFADIKATMTKMGRAIIGIGKGEGENRALEAIKNAVNSPLLENNSLKGARSIIINVCSDSSLLLHEINIIASFIHDEAHPEAHIILGTSIEKSKTKEVMVTIIVTGFEDKAVRVFSKKENIFPENKEGIAPVESYGCCSCSHENSHNCFSQGLEQQNDSFSKKNSYEGNIDIPSYLKNYMNYKQ